MKEKLAIIGSGVAGLGCAYFLHKDYDVYLFEKNDYIGGHTNTVYVEEDGAKIPIDTGFIVYNEVTYPNLIRLFQKLSVETKNSNMSFSVQHIPTKLEYCGSGISGLFAQRRNIFNLRFIKLLFQINRFNKQAPDILNDPSYSNLTIAEYIQKEKFNNDLLEFYLVPMSSAVWSTSREAMLDFPAASLIRFFYNHGFLGLNTQHQWRTVSNGSISYVKKILSYIPERYQTNMGVKRVMRESSGVKIIFENGTSKVFDKVIFATHADTTYSLLDNPLPLEKTVLSSFSYNKNVATLHTDESVMPKVKRAWSSWNYRIENYTGKVSGWDSNIVYWMNKLQGVSDKKNYFVSINDAGNIDPKKIIKTIQYDHPQFNLSAIKAQDQLAMLNINNRIFFCGSYFKYGFHEDAFKSSVELSAKLLKRDPWL